MNCPNWIGNYNLDEYRNQTMDNLMVAAVSFHRAWEAASLNAYFHDSLRLMDTYGDLKAANWEKLPRAAERLVKIFPIGYFEPTSDIAKQFNRLNSWVTILNALDTNNLEH